MFNKNINKKYLIKWRLTGLELPAWSEINQKPWLGPVTLAIKKV
jgi:hypothetical protein